MLWSAFSKSGFEAVGSISNSVGGDGIKQLLIQIHPNCCIPLALNRNHRLEGFEGLNCAFEADGAGLDLLFRGGLRDDNANQVVGQDVGPHFFAN